MNRLLPWLIALLAFAIIVAVGGIAYWLIWLSKDFVPIAASILSGTATLIGVAVGALVLRFNYRSQANPLRLELYKKRMEAFGAIYIKLNVLQMLPARSLCVLDGKSHFNQDFPDNVQNARSNFIDERKKWDLILPSDVQKAAAELIEAVTHLAIAAQEKNSKSYHDLMGIKSKSWINFVNCCRNHLGIKDLSDGILQMIGCEDRSGR